jgi:hypothetical protein
VRMAEDMGAEESGAHAGGENFPDCPRSSATSSICVADQPSEAARSPLHALPAHALASGARDVVGCALDAVASLSMRYVVHVQQ